MQGRDGTYGSGRAALGLGGLRGAGFHHAGGLKLGALSTRLFVTCLSTSTSSIRGHLSYVS